MERNRFIRELEKYHKHLTVRFNKGYDFVNKNPNNKKGVELYESIIKELAEVERLLNFYK